MDFVVDGFMEAPGFVTTVVIMTLFLGFEVAAALRNRERPRKRWHRVWGVVFPAICGALIMAAFLAAHEVGREKFHAQMVEDIRKAGDEFKDAEAAEA